MPSAAFNMVEDGIRQIDTALKEGTFTKNELEAIVMLCDVLKRATQKTLLRGPKSAALKGQSDG